MSRAAEAKARAEAAAAAALAAAAAAEAALIEAEAMVTEEAATAIQAAVRGALQRRRSAKRLAAVVAVQAYVRRWRAKRVARLEREQRDSAAAAAAAAAAGPSGVNYLNEAPLLGTSPAAALAPGDTHTGEKVHTPNVSRPEVHADGHSGGEAGGIGGVDGSWSPAHPLPPQATSPSTPALASMSDALQQLRLAQVALDSADGVEQPAAETTRATTPVPLQPPYAPSVEAVALRAEVAALRAALGTAAAASPARGASDTAGGGQSAASGSGSSLFQSRRAAAEATVAGAHFAGAQAAAAALRARAEAAEAALAAASVRGPFGVPTATLTDTAGDMPTASITLRRCSDVYGQYLTADAPDGLRDGYLLAPADVGLLRAQMAALHRAALSRATLDATAAAAAAAARPGGGASNTAAKRPNNRIQQLEARVAEAQNKVGAQARAAEQRRVEREEKEKRKAEGSSHAAALPPPPPAAPPAPSADASSASSSMVSSLSVPLLFATSPVMSLSTAALTAQLDALLVAFSAWSTATLQPAALPAALEAQLKQWSEAVNGALVAAAATVSSVELPVMPTLTDEYLLSLIWPGTHSVFGTGINSDDWEATALFDTPFSGAVTVNAADDTATPSSLAAAAKQLAAVEEGDNAAWDAIWEKATGGDEKAKAHRPALFEATQEVAPVRREAPRVRINNSFGAPAAAQGGGSGGAAEPVVDAAQMRAETEAERLRTVRKLQAQAAEKARQAAAAAERDEQVAGVTAF